MSDDNSTAQSHSEIAELLAAPFLELDNQLRSLVTRYGPDAVRDAARKATAKKRGRPAEKDWPLLRLWVEQDAEDWLAGRNPFEARSNYFIANEFAAKHPGHNPVATVGRIERKLRESRRLMLFAAAEGRTRKGWPLHVHLLACEELVEAGKPRDLSSLLNHPRGVLARYEERFGKPEPSLSLDDMEAQLRQPLLGSEGHILGSLFGLRLLGS